ncbi:hypothetical protein GCM10008938_42260 [Deinococcus roseus]|uniref:Uncharacterized protein n=2 Tax=Deinococcus roseus TaxID=392414 RepID=A0ABQ2DDC0_9DEIO|nr:hypothetical protein GCM10008938_42260 [Deinococcus roseus]
MVVADHIRFEGELLPQKRWEEFDLLYGCLEHLPDKPEEHILLLGVRCFYAPGVVAEKPYMFIHRDSIRTLQDLNSLE